MTIPLTDPFTAYGHVNGQATLSLALDAQPLAVTAVGTNAMVWNAQMELTPGAHQLTVAALHPSGLFTATATNTFTNSIAGQTTADTFDAAGNLTQRVWLNSNLTTNRLQTLSWDARGRLHAVTERDANNSGYNWSATYDGLSRRLSTTSFLVTNGFTLSTLPTTINSYYDPQVEFLELGVAYGTNTTWKLYGPDLNGRYGGLNGTGGYDADSPQPNLFNPTLSDFRGNILAYYNSAGSSNVWTAARPTGYGAVPDYRPVALANGANLPQSSAWRGRWPDITGYYHIGLRDLNPVSGGWLSSDSTWNERDPNWYTFAGGEPIMGYDADGRLATKAGDYTLDAATDGLMAADAVWNLGVAFLAPQGDTPQEQAGLTQIALDTFGSPLQRIGIYDSSSDSDVFTKQLPSVLGGPLQNIAMAYAGVPGLQPGEVNASETPVNITPDTEVGAEPTIIPLNSGSATTPITTTTDAAENIAVRQGYLDALKAIPGQIDTTLPLREQAMQAFNLRNAAKIDARAAMSDGGALLNKTDPIPTIQDVVRRAYQEKGLVGDDMWRSILESSTRSRASVNQALGVKP